MKYVTLSTAGHVDHGKTSLIRALTGVDTDRLPEEKKREMSIDIGFAFIDYPNMDVRVEIIDIPGHEKFIKNAIAGLSSVQGVILVVDANEGIMPQTVEHLKLMKSFGLDHTVVVITKIDKVEDEIRRLVMEEVNEFLRKEGIQCYGSFCVSVVDGVGLEELKAGIENYIKHISFPPYDAFFKLNIDSAFHVKGYGTVIRGSCVSGLVREGDTLTVEPIGLEGKVRKIQNHGKFVKEGRAGERLAINLPEVDWRSVERGYWLTKKWDFTKTRAVIVQAEGILPGREYLAFFGMREVSTVPKQVEDNCYILRLSQPVLCIRGDRGPILSTSGKYVGSYKVLHPNPRRLSKRFLREGLSILKEDLIVYQLFEWGKDGVEIRCINSSFGKPLNPQSLSGFRIGNRIYSTEVLKDIKESIKATLDKTNGIIELSKLRGMLKISEEVTKSLLSELKGYAVLEGFLIDERKAKIEDLEDFKKLMDFMGESIKEEKELEAFRGLLILAIKRGYILSIGNFLYLKSELFGRYVEELRSIGKVFTLQQAKEKLKLTRKYLIPLLEHIDRIGMTVREGDVRRFIR